MGAHPRRSCCRWRLLKPVIRMQAICCINSIYREPDHNLLVLVKRYWRKAMSAAPPPESQHFALGRQPRAGPGCARSSTIHCSEDTPRRRPHERTLGLRRADPRHSLVRGGGRHVRSPLDPATSKRQLHRRLPDGSGVVPLVPLLADVAKSAPGNRYRHPPDRRPIVSRARPQGIRCSTPSTRVKVDLAAIAFGAVPSRFVSRHLYDEDFLVAAREGIRFFADPSIDAYCAADHVLVSTTGDTATYVPAISFWRRVGRAASGSPSRTSSSPSPDRRNPTSSPHAAAAHRRALCQTRRHRRRGAALRAGHTQPHQAHGPALSP